MESNWENIVIEPSDVQNVKYKEEGVIRLDGNFGSYDLGDFAGQKILRMTKSYKRKLDMVENRRTIEEDILSKLQSRKDPFVLRQWKADGVIKSVVGTDYVPIDTQELGVMAGDVLTEERVDWQWGEITPLRYVRSYDRTVLIMTEQRTVKVGDLVRSGIIIMNNELGARSMKVQMFIERLVCTNGMTSKRFGHEFSKVHLGNKDSMLDQFRDAVRRIVSNRWDLNPFLEKAITISLTRGEIRLIIEHHQQDGLISAKTAIELIEISESGTYGSGSADLFGLINAYTGLATHGKSWSVRDQLENIIDVKLLAAQNKEQLLG